MYLQILAAILPMPYDVHPLAAMMAPAAPRVCAAIEALKSEVSWSGRARRRGVVPIAALDHAICTVSFVYRVIETADVQTGCLHARRAHKHRYCSVLPQPSAPEYLSAWQNPDSFLFRAPRKRGH